jgi:uncharacterized membrane protein YebE (DUF533 family)
MKMQTLGLGLLAMLATTWIAAQAPTPKIDKKEARQETRIDQGKASGQLNNREAARLDAGQAKVDGMQAAAKADGKVTKTERRAIKREQNRQSKKIYRQKHDAQAKNPS